MRLRTNYNSLHIFAMIAMLADHIWKKFNIGGLPLAILGRMAMPIFCFLLVEGFFHTRNIKKYIFRIFAFALLSEIPFDLMVSNSIIDVTYQNVMWTFLISMLTILIVDRLLQKFGNKAFLIGVPITFIAACLCIALKTDYSFYGVLSVVVLYIIKKYKISKLSAPALFLLTFSILCPAQYYQLKIIDVTLNIRYFSVLAAIPIILYSDKIVSKTRFFKWFNYLFYPAHMLLIFLISIV